MVIIIMSLPQGVKERVIPRESPTVPKAERSSKRISKKGPFSVRVRRRVEIATHPAPRTKTAIAWWTTPEDGAMKNFYFCFPFQERPYRDKESGEGGSFNSSTGGTRGGSYKHKENEKKGGGIGKRLYRDSIEPCGTGGYRLKPGSK